VYQRVQLERLVDEFELAGLHLREVQDVPDHAEQRLAGYPQRLGVLALLECELGLEQEAA
jgi:hypothetical protein